jgi:hypothetical protein
LGDLNADGRADLLVLRSVFPNFDLGIFEGRADGTLAKVAEYTPHIPDATCSPSPYPLIDDLDQDGDRDIIVGCQGAKGGVLPLWNQGRFTFWEVIYSPIYMDVYGLTAGDLDGDGARELIAAAPGSEALCVLTFEGFTSYKPPACFGTLPSLWILATDVALLDVEHDGFPEVLGSGVEAGSTLLRLR